ncbi:DUF4349 domain-containing protein [uncultured Bacteroides sp.]|uniref:DUF4349 domain-containing protein n=1 Tax=uncultured Bacteroides sp. TaxID=162156 RepID=UPI002AAAEF4F|nr:DUF4349 domain-containing protein [uncultured Bacteroides sp.]
MKKIICFIFLSMFLLTGCGAKDTNGASNEITTLSRLDEASTSKLDVPPLKSSAKEDYFLRKLIKNGSVKFQTNDIKKTDVFIKSAVKKFDAYISNDEDYSNESNKGCDITIRVPAAKYDSLMAYILNNADIRNLDNKSTNIEDVTTDYIDNQTRLKIKKASEAKLIVLLNKAKDLKDLLAVQKQLTDLQAEIESIEGKMKYLNDQVNYSTLTVSFYKNAVKSNTFVGDFWNALKNGWQVFLQALTFIANLWVIILVSVFLVLGFKSYRRRKKNAKNN